MYFFELTIGLISQRVHPSQFPRSINLFLFYVLVYLITGFISLINDSLLSLTLNQVIILVIFECICLAAYTYLILFINGFTNRFFQLFGSLIAIGGLLNLAYVAVHLLSIFFGPNNLLILIMYLLIFIASIHISGWIIGQAISNFYATGVFIMLGYTGIWMFLSGLVV